MPFWADIADSIVDVCMDTFDVEDLVRIQPGGGQVALRGIFRDAHTVMDPDLRVPVSTDKPRVDFRNADYVPHQDDEYIIRGRYYRASDVQPDGEAATSVELYDLGYRIDSVLAARSATLAVTASAVWPASVALAAQDSTVAVDLGVA